MTKRIDVFQLTYKKDIPICTQSSIQQCGINNYKVINIEKTENIIKYAINIGYNNPYALVLCSFILFNNLNFNKNGLPYFIRTRPNKLDFGCFYVNNCCNWFLKLNYIEKLNQIQKRKHYYSIPHKYYTKLKEK